MNDENRVQESIVKRCTDALKVAAQRLAESNKELAKVVESLEQTIHEQRQYEAELIRLRRKGTLIL